MKQAVGIFRGSNAKLSVDLDLSRIPEHGSGKHFDLGDAERLFETLLIEQAFDEDFVANGGGFSNAYLKVSR
jgi:bloom syndrome protein